MPCRLQDEYCEWFVYRQMPNGPISRIVFTAEAPEYWITLAKHDFEPWLQLYREHVVADHVQPDDLEVEAGHRVQRRRGAEEGHLQSLQQVEHHGTASCT